MRLKNFTLQPFVEHTNVAGFYNNVSALRGLQHSARMKFISLINHYCRPVRIFNIAMLLSLKSLGLVKRDLMTTIRQRFNNAAIVASSAVPIRRDETGTKERNLEPFNCRHERISLEIILSRSFSCIRSQLNPTF